MNKGSHKKQNVVLIIAEAGVNHNGDLKLAKKMVDVAFEAGADAVKFQTYRAESLVSRAAPKAEYQQKLTQRDESQLEMLKRFELDRNAHKELLYYCRKKGIMFLSSAFDLESLELLKEIECEIYKVPSGEINNLPYLRKLGALRKKVILSTGMSELSEIMDALDILVEGGTPRKNITVLHCNTEYPSPYEDVNLLAMVSMKDSLNVSIGYSDHSLGIEIPIAAVALGASVIEKHFTLSKNMDGPDHRASLDPDELKAMVKAIRNIEKALGHSEKKPTPSERNNKTIVRKSIMAARNIKKGEIFTQENVTVKRPGTGMSPMRWDDVMGRKVPRDFKKDELIEL